MEIGKHNFSALDAGYGLYGFKLTAQPEHGSRKHHRDNESHHKEENVVVDSEPDGRCGGHFRKNKYGKPGPGLLPAPIPQMQVILQKFPDFLPHTHVSGLPGQGCEQKTIVEFT